MTKLGNLLCLDYPGTFECAPSLQERGLPTNTYSYLYIQRQEHRNRIVKIKHSSKVLLRVPIWLNKQLKSKYQYLDVLILQNKLRIYSLHWKCINTSKSKVRCNTSTYSWIKTPSILERGTKPALPQSRKLPLSLSICKFL